MSKKSCLLTFLIFFLASFTILTLFTWSLAQLTQNLNGQSTDEDNTQKYTYKYGSENSQNKILSIPISGVILDTPSNYPGIFDFLTQQSYTFGYEIKSQILKAAQNSEIQGIILEINSPGGTINGSKAISDGIEMYKQKTQKPVYAHISGIGASGAYWVAASSDKISTDYGSLTGSIGVVMGPFKHYKQVVAESGEFGDSVSTLEGIDTYYLTAGENKDLGNPYKEMPQKVKDTLQQGLDQEYGNFVSYVSKKRQISEDEIKTNIGALVYENQQALKNKLVDAEMSKDNAYIDLALKLNFTQEDFQIVQINTPQSFFEELFKPISQLNTQKPITCILCNKMLYLYNLQDITNFN